MQQYEQLVHTIRPSIEENRWLQTICLLPTRPIYLQPILVDTLLEIQISSYQGFAPLHADSKHSISNLGPVTWSNSMISQRLLHFVYFLNSQTALFPLLLQVLFLTLCRVRNSANSRLSRSRFSTLDVRMVSSSVSESRVFCREVISSYGKKKVCGYSYP